ncbi:MAG: Zinc carboxypeptidase [Candidatus Krumholzibacteriota bacterium]|nr:Zinc carboxypeptidase [Candidatus Krumholzibacteriota bacterium]
MNRLLTALIAAAATVCVVSSVGSAEQRNRDWRTDCEKSGMKATPRYDETIAYCKRLDKASQWIRYTTFGKSPQGRDLPLVIASKRGVFAAWEAERARQNGDVVVLIQAGIHSGEIEGKDAGLMLLRDIAIDKKYHHVTVLFIPIFNVDGHERFGPYNRINQNGPEEMGWRTTANGLNLNRDFLKVDAEETRAWVNLFNQWKPDFFIDSHTTDGADYQYAVTYIVDILGNMVPSLTDWTRDVYLANITRTMEQAGYPMSPYVYLVEWPNPRSGMVTWVSTPRFAQGYASIQNRPGILIETHQRKDYAVRVSATYEAMKQTIELLDRERAGLRNAISTADAYTASAAFREKPFPLRFQLDRSDSVLIAFKGVSYDTLTSDLTGGKWYQFTGKPETFTIPFFNKQKITATASLPEAYIVPPEWTAVIQRLAIHGVEFRQLSAPATLEVRSYRFENYKWQEEPYEGRHPVKFEAKPVVETRTYPAGSVVVDMNQRASQVAAHILEPMGPDSYLQWGFFDAVFEQKEYTDADVIEKKGREMLARDESLRKELEAKKAADPEFAKHPGRIRNWLYQHSPYWDDRKDVYPVGMIVDRKLIDYLPLKR